MSCIMSDPPTIDRVVDAIWIYAQENPGVIDGNLRWAPSGGAPRTHVGQQLVNLNAHAFIQRYGDRHGDTMENTVYPYTYQPSKAPRAQLARSCEFFLYQCSEGNTSQFGLFQRMEIIRDYMVKSVPKADLEAAAWD